MSGQTETDPVKDGSAANAWPANLPPGVDSIDVLVRAPLPRAWLAMQDAANRTTERMEKAARTYAAPIDIPASYVTTNLADSILKTLAVANEVVDERSAQEARWGEQNHPDGTSAIGWDWQAENAKFSCEEARRNGRMTWRHILLEEVFEAFAEEHPGRLRAELLQVAAVSTAWVEAIDRREAQNRTESARSCPSGDLSDRQNDKEESA